MSELLPKPSRSDYHVTDRLNYAEAEIIYYKRLSEFAIAKLERLASSEAFDVSRHTTKEERMRIEFAEQALSTIKGSQS